MDEDNNQVDPKTGLRGWEEGREEKGREGATVGAMHDACTMHARTRQQKTRKRRPSTQRRVQFVRGAIGSER